MRANSLCPRALLQLANIPGPRPAAIVEAFGTLAAVLSWLPSLWQLDPLVALPHPLVRLALLRASAVEDGAHFAPGSER